MKRCKVMQVVLSMSILIILTGCNRVEDNQNSTDEKTDIITLRALSIGTPPANGMDSFYERLDALTIPDLGCIVRFDYIPWGDERKQINIAIASGEYDFIPGGVFSDYQIMAAKNAFINLYDYMDAVPELESHYKQYREDYLSAFEINGKLYGLPQYNIGSLYSLGAGFLYREDLRRKWGLQPVTDFKTFEAYLYRAKKDAHYKDYPIITDNRIWMCLWYMFAGNKYLELNSALDTPLVVVSVDNPSEPVSRFETPEFQLVLETVKKWYDDGILEPSILASSNNEGMLGLEMMKQDQKPCETNAAIWAITDKYIPELYEVNPDWEFGYYDYSTKNSPIYLSSNTATTVISISSKSDYPELAIRFLEKAHTNRDYYDLLNYGVEGIHYNIIDNYVNFSGISADDAFSGWTGAPDGYFYYKSKSVNPVWQREVLDKVDEKNNRISENAPYYPLDGFNYDISKVSDIYKSIDEVRLRYVQPLSCGVTDNLSEDYGEAISLLKKAGIDAYVNDVRIQLKKFFAKKQ